MWVAIGEKRGCATLRTDPQGESFAKARKFRGVLHFVQDDGEKSKANSKSEWQDRPEGGRYEGNRKTKGERQNFGKPKRNRKPTGNRGAMSIPVR